MRLWWREKACNQVRPSAVAKRSRSDAQGERRLVRTHFCSLIRLKTVLDKLEAEAPAPGGVARALLLSGEDDFLKSLLEQLASAEGRLATLQKGRDPEDPEVTVIRRQMEDLGTQIQTRSEGVLSGMKARLLSRLQLLLDEGQQKGAGRLAE